MGTDHEEPPQVPWTPSVLTAGAVIAWMKLLMKTAGLAGALNWIRRTVGTRPNGGLLDLAEVQRSERVVALAGALYPGRAQCLEQSLALYFLARRRGIPVKFQMGVQSQPFAAHAWIEYAGAPVNDLVEHIQYFTRLPEQLP